MKVPVSSAAPPFRPRATDEVKTPRSRRDDGYLSSTPNQVSDDSGEVEPESDLSLSQSLSHDLSKSLSHISHAPSSEEDSPTGPTINGRWNIPFDGSFEELVAKKSPLGKGNALKEIGFVPISSTREHRRPSLGLGGCASKTTGNEKSRRMFIMISSEHGNVFEAVHRLHISSSRVCCDIYKIVSFH